MDEKFGNNKVSNQNKISSSIASKNFKADVKVEKIFTKGHYLWALAAFLVYTLLSILIRKEFNLESAYDVSVEKNPILGVGVTLLLNYGVIPLLLMAYFYRKNNGKHNVFLVIAYILILIGCFLDGILPYIKTDTLKGENWINALVYPTVYLVGHRLVSLLAYAILKKKEGESDYRIYFAFVLLAPFTAGVLLIGAIGYLLITGQYKGNSSNNGQQGQQSAFLYSLEVKQQVRRELTQNSGGCNVAIYYEDGWKLVDYWDHGCKLEEIFGPNRGCTYLKTPEGKIYILTTNCPDKEKIYFFR